MEQQHSLNRLVQDARRLLNQLQMPTVDVNAVTDRAAQMLYALAPEYPIVSFSPLSILRQKVDAASVEDVQNNAGPPEKKLTPNWPLLEPASMSTTVASTTASAGELPSRKTGPAALLGSDPTQRQKGAGQPGLPIENSQPYSATNRRADSDQRGLNEPHVGHTVAQAVHKPGAAPSAAEISWGPAPGESATALLSSIVDAALAANQPPHLEEADGATSVNPKRDTEMAGGQRTGSQSATSASKPASRRIKRAEQTGFTGFTDDSRSSALTMIEQLTQQLPQEIKRKSGKSGSGATTNLLEEPGKTSNLHSPHSMEDSLAQRLAVIRPDLIEELDVAQPVSAASVHASTNGQMNGQSRDSAMPTADIAKAASADALFPDPSTLASTLATHVNAALVEQARLHGVDLS